MKKYLQKFQNQELLNIVCIGDSTTSQEWCHPNWSDWLNFTFRQSGDWSKSWNRKVFNNGKDGGTIQDYLEYFDREIARFSPDVVIVSLGFNHIEQSKNIQVLEEFQEQLFTRIQSIGADIITWSTYDVPHVEHSKSLSTISDVYKKMTQKFEGVFVDIYQEFQKYDLNHLFTYTSDEGNAEWKILPGQQDYLHCNEIGNQIIAEEILREAFNVPILQWKQFGTMQGVDLRQHLK